MRALLSGLVGLGVAALISGATLTVASCSCPPGYQARPIPPGAYTVEPQADAGVGGETDHRFVVDATIARETFTRAGARYEIVYRVTGVR